MQRSSAHIVKDRGFEYLIVWKLVALVCLGLVWINKCLFHCAAALTGSVRFRYIYT